MPGAIRVPWISKPQEVPVGICEPVQRVSLARSRASATRARRTDERLDPSQRRPACASGLESLDVGKPPRQVRFRYRDDSDADPPAAREGPAPVPLPTATP